MRSKQFVYQRKDKINLMNKKNLEEFLDFFRQIEKKGINSNQEELNQFIEQSNIIEEIKKLRPEDLDQKNSVGYILYALSKSKYFNEILNFWQSENKFNEIIQTNFTNANLMKDCNEITSVIWLLRHNQNFLNKTIDLAKSSIETVLNNGSVKNVNKLLITASNSQNFLSFLRDDNALQKLVQQAIAFLDETNESTLKFDFNQLFLRAILEDPTANYDSEKLKSKEEEVESFLRKICSKSKQAQAKTNNLPLLAHLKTNFNRHLKSETIKPSQYLLKNNNDELANISRTDPSSLLLNMPDDTFVWIELPEKPKLSTLCALHVINNNYYITGAIGGSMLKKGKTLAVKLEYLYGESPTRIQDFLKLSNFRSQFAYFQRFVIPEILPQINSNNPEGKHNVLSGTLNVYHAAEGQIIHPDLNLCCEDGCGYMTQSTAKKFYRIDFSAKQTLKKKNTSMPFSALQEIKKEEQDTLGKDLYKQSLAYNVQLTLNKLSNGDKSSISNETEKLYAKKSLRSVITTGSNTGFHGVVIPISGDDNTILLPQATKVASELAILRVPCDKMNLKKINFKTYHPLDEIYALQYSLVGATEKALVAYKGIVVVIPDKYWPKEINADLIASTEDRKIYSLATNKEAIKPKAGQYDKVFGVLSPINYIPCENLIGISSKVLKGGMSGDFDGDEINGYSFESYNPFPQLLAQPVQEKNFWEYLNPKISKEYKAHNGVLLRLAENQNIQSSLVNYFTTYYNSFVALNRESQKLFATAFLAENRDLTKLINPQSSDEDDVGCVKLCLATGLKVGTDLFKTNKDLKPFLNFLEKYKATLEALKIPLPIYFKSSLDKILSDQNITLDDFNNRIYAQKPFYKGGYVYDYLKKLFKNISFEPYEYIKNRWQYLDATQDADKLLPKKLHKNKLKSTSKTKSHPLNKPEQQWAMSSKERALRQESSNFSSTDFIEVCSKRSSTKPSPCKPNDNSTLQPTKPIKKLPTGTFNLFQSLQELTTHPGGKRNKAKIFGSPNNREHLAKKLEEEDKNEDFDTDKFALNQNIQQTDKIEEPAGEKFEEADNFVQRQRRPCCSIF